MNPRLAMLIAPALAFAPAACSEPEPVVIPQTVKATCNIGEDVQELGFNPQNGRTFFTRERGMGAMTTIIEANGHENTTRRGQYQEDTPGAPVQPTPPANYRTNRAAWDQYQAAKAEYARTKTAWDEQQRQEAAAERALPLADRINRLGAAFTQRCADNNAQVTGDVAAIVRQAVSYTTARP